MGKRNTYGLSTEMVIPSNKTGEYEVISFEPKSMVRLKSLYCGNEVIVRTSDASKGRIGNKNYPTFFSKGYLGIGDYKTRNGTSDPKNKFYTVWENMLARCYYPKTARYNAYGGVGVTVCKEWLNFQTFAKWFEDNYVEGWHLDKDILGDGSEYNPTVCRFIPQEVNGSLVNNTCNTGKSSNLPTGVSVSRDGYQCTLNLKRTNNYRYQSSSIKAVMQYYEKNKTKVVREVVESYKDIICNDIYETLISYKFQYTKEEYDEFY